MTTDDPAAKDWKEAVDRDHATRAEVLEALTDLGMAYASQTVVLLRARRERDSLARRLAKRFQEQKRAQAIIEYALLYGRDAGPEWHHRGACSWPERACTGHVTSYPPVQVPENTGKHPAESGEIPTKAAS